MLVKWICLILLIESIREMNSTSCSIFVQTNCSCYQTDLEWVNPSMSSEDYSILHCRIESLEENPFQSPFGFDYDRMNSFRKISIDFNLVAQIRIGKDFFHSLKVLYSKVEEFSQVELILKFDGFTQIQFEENSFSSNIFPEQNQFRILTIHLIPFNFLSTNDLLQSGNLSLIDKQFLLDDRCFSSLNLTEMNIHIHTINNYFPTSLKFESLFNESSIEYLHFYKSLINPSENNEEIFLGSINWLIIHRYGESIDDFHYPFYRHVQHFGIDSIGSYSIDLRSFVNRYSNLEWLRIDQPNFDLTINEDLSSLKTLILNVQRFDERTVESVRHIQYFKLGSNLRQFDATLHLHLLFIDLKQFDLSSVDLSLLTSDSVCRLIQYISLDQNHHNITLLLPKQNSYDQCQCAQIYIEQMQEKTAHEQDFYCFKQCRFSDCPRLSSYFIERLSQIDKSNNSNWNKFHQIHWNELKEDQQSMSIDFHSDYLDQDLIHFLHLNTSQVFSSTTLKPMKKISTKTDFHQTDLTRQSKLTFKSMSSSTSQTEIISSNNSREDLFQVDRRHSSSIKSFDQRQKQEKLSQSNRISKRFLTLFGLSFILFFIVFILCFALFRCVVIRRLNHSSRTIISV